MQILIILPVILLAVVNVYVYFRNPYAKIYDSIIKRNLIIIQQIILTVPTAALWATGLFDNYDSILYFIAAMLVAGCILLGVIISIVRLNLEYKLKNPPEKKNKNAKKDDKKEKKQSVNEKFIEMIELDLIH